MKNVKQIASLSFALMLGGCANIATQVALVNVLATERSLEPEKPVKPNNKDKDRARVSAKNCCVQPMSFGVRQDKQPRFSERFGHWKKTSMDLWGPA